MSIPNLSILEERDQHIALAKTVAKIILSQLNIKSDEIKEREAFREFGESEIRSLRNEKLITWVRGPAINSPHTYSRIEIETVIRLKNERKLKQ